jgi:hypothetical protein
VILKEPSTTAELEAVDPDKSNNHFRKALLCVVQAEVAAGYRKWKDAERMYSTALREVEENVKTRDYPFEWEMYGDSMARLGMVLGQSGEVESGCHYIERGLQIMYALHDSNRYNTALGYLKGHFYCGRHFGPISKGAKEYRLFGYESHTID